MISFVPNRCRNCDTNLTSDTVANKYQQLKLINNNVRVSESEYILNKSALIAGHNVKPWNQQSDRAVPSFQKELIKTGFHNSMNSRHASKTSSRPGCQTPGGVGVDIKHNSYDRYLNRIKAYNLKSGIVISQKGRKMNVNSIISSCYCPNNIFTEWNGGQENKIIDLNIVYYIGMLVWINYGNCCTKKQGYIVDIDNVNNIYKLRFKDNTTGLYSFNDIVPAYKEICTSPDNNLALLLKNIMSNGNGSFYYNDGSVNQCLL
jgi:hypothetical protein